MKLTERHHDILRALADESGPVSAATVAEQSLDDSNPSRVSATLGALTRAGLVTTQPTVPQTYELTQLGRETVEEQGY